MKAYRVNITGTKEHYLVTEHQKNAIDRIIDEGKNSFLTINGDRIRISMIRSIQFANVDLEGCPDYFVERVKQENSGGLPGQLSESEKKLRSMPKSWIVLDENMKPITEQNGRLASGATRSVIYPGGDRHWFLANCHYEYHFDEEKGRNVVDSYIVSPIEKVAELLQVREDKDEPSSVCIMRKWVYGEENALGGNR